MVGIGGFAGSIARYLLSQYFSKVLLISFPVGTFFVNILGSFFIGVIYAATEEHPFMLHYRLLLATGFCGGFTTFSAFASENLNLLQKGEYFMFLTYIVSSIVLGIIAVFLGIYFTKWLK